ncbi:MAG: DegV family protein [Lachnospiraceae bacterium]|nr:DegV family protein [Lachnospiraceae bacterium]MDE6252959.1 DegV family protein [Lachnospiraceae bacterium]
MNKEKVAILADSGCDIPKDFIEKYDIKLLGLKVIYGMEIYTDGVDIDPMTIYERFPDEIPTTSTPNANDIINILDNIKSEGYEKVIAVCISSKLSGTFNTVKTTLEEYNGLTSFALDSKNISIGSGLLAMWAAVQLENGMDFNTVTQTLEKKTIDSHVYFYMDTLDYLKAGGRIGNVTGLIGKALNLKPIISCDEEGVYKTVTMLRGSKNAVNKIVDIVRKNTKGDNVWLSIMNGHAADKVEEVENTLKENFSNAEIVAKKQIVASLAVHTGPGLVGIGVLNL